jgi:hypothetical protein
MTHNFGSFGGSHSHGHGHGHSHDPAGTAKAGAAKKPTFTKVFRWEPLAGQGVPTQVEILGSFTGWKKLPLVRSAVTGTWQITIENILSNRTHHYMLLVAGQPVSDKHCDGLAVPTEAVETQYALATPRGPRVLMLFAQTK